MRLKVNIFNKYFATKGEFVFEGIWFRSQEEVNKNVASGKFTQEEGKQIVEYAQNLAKAIGLTL